MTKLEKIYSKFAQKITPATNSHVSRFALHVRLFLLKKSELHDDATKGVFAGKQSISQITA